jgi:hypothetical protein
VPRQQDPLDLALPGGRPEPERQLRLVGRSDPEAAAVADRRHPDELDAQALRDAAEVEAFCQATPTPTAQLPDPRRWTARLAQAALEVMAGARPVAQLVRLVDERVYAQLQLRGRAASRRPGPKPRRVLRSVHVSQPRDGVVEATAVFWTGERCQALALRIEGWDGRWRATELHLI